MINPTHSVDDLTPEEARAILTLCPDKLLHDVVCECESADIGRAMAMLAKADWTVREAFEAWYATWLEDDYRA